VSLYLKDPDVTLHCGDALEVLRELPDRSVHMCATSPPFYGLRDYGTGTWEGGDESVGICLSSRFEALNLAAALAAGSEGAEVGARE
jgi:hypothetical protein